MGDTLRRIEGPAAMNAMEQTVEESALDFVVRRDDLRERRFVQASSPSGLPLSAGQVLLRVDRFALTANTLTYAALGDAMGYWKLFPTLNEWGRVPAWGIGTVARSESEGVAAGARYYGLFPMSTYATLEPHRVRPHGFIDGAAHRRDVHHLYNGYTLVTPAFAHDAAAEARVLLLRPLFITSFVLDDLLADEQRGIHTIVLSSASSKTACGLAFLLGRRKREASLPITIVGLTAATNAEFTRNVALYDDVVTYDAIETLPNDVPTVFVDFSGNAATRDTLHRRLGATLRANYAVGYTHRNGQHTGRNEDLPGPEPIIFFSPDEIAKRVRAWGPGGFEERFAVAWEAFVDAVCASDRSRLQVLEGHGSDALDAAYLAVLDGRTKPSDGHVLSL